MGPTALFTHLKIILLQYFQFSAISSIQTHPKYLFGNNLFSWNWKFFTENMVNKAKR